MERVGRGAGCLEAVGEVRRDRQRSACRGACRFTYALFPHAGPPTSGGVIVAAHALNAPLRLRAIEALADVQDVPGTHSLLQIDDPGVVVSALKPADDGDGRIVRLYEAFGGTRRVTLRSPGTTRAERVDLLEEPLEGAPLAVEAERIELSLRPFELVTLRLRGEPVFGQRTEG